MQYLKAAQLLGQPHSIFTRLLNITILTFCSELYCETSEHGFAGKSIKCEA